MKEKILFLTGFFGFLPFFILALILYSLYLLHAGDRNHTNLYGFAPVVHYQALPEQKEVSSIDLDTQDARVAVLTDFFQSNHSILTPYAQEIVTDADKYGLDYRLLPAIAMQESTLCQKFPKNSFNCWGFGIYTGHMTKFSSFDEAIDTISKTLDQQYKAYGLVTPDAIMTKYTPSSNGSWAAGVNLFMTKINNEL